MAKALEIISPDEIYSDLIFKDPVPPHTIYRELTKLVDRNASNERIANRAFDFFSSGLMSERNYGAANQAIEQQRQAERQIQKKQAKWWSMG
ncbi:MULTISPECIES: hypothetical protein [Neisseria]|uniref:hypothetical protein n=1 Tax=Neisseria TaxID=482 RepID=UPI0001D9DA57|nr:MULTISPECIES: hypothetical protein [Neisseria]EFH23760.1 hypothetical protein NEIPOLOT_00399 [Neisseria polysaccharea ATCC 43768]SUA15808.1 Uncharacterised protein [Neisseria lactamica]